MGCWQCIRKKSPFPGVSSHVLSAQWSQTSAMAGGNMWLLSTRYSPWSPFPTVSKDPCWLPNHSLRSRDSGQWPCLTLVLHVHLQPRTLPFLTDGLWPTYNAPISTPYLCTVIRSPSPFPPLPYAPWPCPSDSIVWTNNELIVTSRWRIVRGVHKGLQRWPWQCNSAPHPLSAYTHIIPGTKTLLLYQGFRHPRWGTAWLLTVGHTENNCINPELPL